jgi:hypothetical protein
MTRCLAPGSPVDLIYVTAPSCRLCERGWTVLVELQERFALSIREVDLLSDDGRRLIAVGRVPFPPALFAEDRLLAHGRLSAGAIERELSALGAAARVPDRRG